MLRSTDNPQRPVYEKGLVAEVAKFLFGEGFAIGGGWGAWVVSVGGRAQRGQRGSACSLQRY